MVYLSEFILIFILLEESCICSVFGTSHNEPLILTPYLKSNKIEEAKRLSQVHHTDFQDVLSYSGYFTVHEQFNSNSFFWFFPSENNYLNDPVLLWLQGGPGISSLYGLFEEHGPFKVKNDTVSIREYRWSKNHSVLYIDNPAGTGFSFTNKGYARNQTQIGKELHEALSQFFTLFKEIKNNDFFVSGESYAGKYVPALSYIIYKKNPTSDVFINLKGLLINNGFVDPPNQIDYGEYVYQLGLIDSNIKKELDDIRDKILEDIETERSLSAFIKFHYSLNLIKANSGITSIHNYQLVNTKIKYYDMQEDWANYVNKKDVRSAIHVSNNLKLKSDFEIVGNLADEFTDSVAPWLSELLEHYPVLLFSGQLDVIVPYPTTVNFIKKLNFSAVEEYKRAIRYKWMVDTEVAGYCKRGGFLHECLVRNAGHVVPFDQPKYAFDLVYKFVRNISLFSENTQENEINIE